MRAHMSRIQVGQEMNLRTQKKDEEQQADHTAISAVYSHVLGKTQLRGESLPGQERAGRLGSKATARRFAVSNQARLDVTCI